MNRNFLATGIVLSAALAVSCRAERQVETVKGNLMPTTTERLIADLFSAASADQERDNAIALADHLQESGDAWSLSLREPNSTTLLTPQEYLVSESALAILTARDAAYVWVPRDKRNIDMLMLE